MARVRLQFREPKNFTVTLTIECTYGELEDYANSYKPSYALGHRIMEAITEAQLTMMGGIVKEVVSGG